MFYRILLNLLAISGRLCERKEKAPTLHRRAQITGSRTFLRRINSPRFPFLLDGSFPLSHNQSKAASEHLALYPAISTDESRVPSSINQQPENLKGRSNFDMKFLRLISIAALTSHTFSFDEQRVLQDDNTKTAHVTVATKKLEEFIEKTLKEWKMPGMSVAIVEGNETWLRVGFSILPRVSLSLLTFQGFGWDRKSDMRPVSPYQTLFYVGSLTKSFTAAAMAQIVENNVDFPDVQWDTPISSLLRDDFVLSDLCATEHITIEDALSHRTGYPAHDFVSWDSPRAATRGLRDLPMSAQPRSRFQYSNQMVTTVGYLIEKLYERANPYHFPTTLEQVMISKLWGPMNMFRTHFDFYSGVPSTAADELWYHNDSGSYVVVPHDTHRGHLGAGMAISCAQDFARYMSRMMDPNWGPISARAKAAIKAPHMVIAPSHPQYTGPYYYGLGWTGAVFEGEEVWFHDGQMREHRTEMWMAPGRNFSVVIMANANTPAVKIVLWKIIYDFFGVDEGRRFEVEKRFLPVCRAGTGTR